MSIGILNHAKVAEDSIRGFKEVLAENGYVEGKTVSYLYAGPVAKDELLKEAERLVDGGADLILSITMPASLAAIGAGTTEKVPLLFAPNSNPVAAGIVESMERPGGNVTGVSFWIQEDKRLEWLKRLVPGVKKVLVPYMDWDESPRIAIEELESVALKIGIEIQRKTISHPGEIAGAAGNIPADVDAVFIPADALIESNAPAFIARGLDMGIPVTSPQSFGFTSGALFAYGFVQYETGKRGAHLALQILQGEPPGELPVEMAETKLMINLKTAERLNLDIPTEIISKADIVIR